MFGMFKKLFENSNENFQNMQQKIKTFFPSKLG
jgi:hypothetical protein